MIRKEKQDTEELWLSSVIVISDCDQIFIAGDMIS